MDAFSPQPFDEAARRAFPPGLGAGVRDAVLELSPLIDDTYRQRSEAVDVLGQMVAIPRRLHFAGLSSGACRQVDGLSLTSRCLITRATDGHLRQQAVRSILFDQSPWVAPFVLMLLGDYVIEIVEDIRDAAPALDRAVYANLIRENRGLVRTLRERATSYWNAHYRFQHPFKRDYPALQALHEMETWAA